MRDTKRKKQRVLAPMQLVVGDDDDLIEWYLSFPSGQRHQQLKDTLRAGLGLAVQPVQAVEAAQAHAVAAAKIATLESELQQLRAWAEQWFQYLSQPTAQTNGTSVLEAVEDHLSQERIEERKSRLKKATW